MNEIGLSMCVGANERTRALVDGRVAPEGIALTTSVAFASEIFWRQLKYSEFDVSEMSLSSLFAITARGSSEWVGLPVFPSRKFFHTGILVGVGSGIDSPADLVGKRVGVPEYQQTGAVWARGALQHEFGVDLTSVRWFMERTAGRSHGSATGFHVPPGIELHHVPDDDDLGSMMIAGRLDAVLLYFVNNNLVDRSTVDLHAHRSVRPLFSQPDEEARRYFGSTNLWPMNHCVVVRRSILDQHPWVALNLYNAFRRAQQEAWGTFAEMVSPLIAVGLAPVAADITMRPDPMDYGIRSNRHTLDVLARYCFEQGITRRLVSIDEIFATSTLEM